MQVEVDGTKIRVKRELEDGWFQHIEMPLPAVLTIQSGINKLRYATLMGIKKAKTKEIKRITFDGAAEVRPSFGDHRKNLRAAKEQAGADFRRRREDRRGEAGRKTEDSRCGSYERSVVSNRAATWHRMSGRRSRATVGPASSSCRVAARSSALRRSHLLETTRRRLTRRAVEELVRKVNPALVLFPHTYQVRDFAPKAGYTLCRVLISDVIAARRTPRRVRAPVVPRQAERRCAIVGEGPHFASLQAGAWRAEAFASTVETFTPKRPRRSGKKPEAPFRESARAVDLTAAEIIVSVGRGIKEKENIPVVEELAKALGAELAASRPICDAGWLPMERQVGSSGQTVAPKMYMAVGISGAIQHLVGMKGAKTIVAINKDANAPIFEVARLRNRRRSVRSGAGAGRGSQENQVAIPGCP